MRKGGKKIGNKGKQKGGMKKVMIALLCVALVGTGISLALLTAGPEEEVNAFTVIGSEGIEVAIEEEFDEKEAGKMKPGVPVEKEPLLVNASEEELDIYVAMQVVLVAGDATEFDPEDVLTDEQYTKLMDMLYIRYDTSITDTNYNLGSSKWQTTSATGNGAVYIWSRQLGRGEKTEVLFKDVMLKTEAGNAEADWIAEELGGFEIVIRGAAVQADGITMTEAETQLVQLLDYTQGGN